MIRTEHLTRRYHEVVAVNDVSLRVARGEVMGFVGPNGAGKTTTLRILTGFLPASSGRAQVAGLDVATHSLAVRRQIGYLPENVPLPDDVRVDEYLDFRARLKGVAARQRAAQRDRVVSMCGLASVSRRIVSQLSRGFRQRVGLADALVADPPVLILDEPTAALDPGQRQDVLDLVAALGDERTVLLSSHVLAEVESVCTRVAIIQEGRLVAEGTKEELERSVGRRGAVRLAAAGAAEALRSWLDERGLTPEPEGDGFVVYLPDHSQEAPLLRAAILADLPLTRFEPLERSLHEIFLDLVRKEGAG